MATMMQASELLAYVQAIKDRWGDTCFWVPELAWGSVSLGKEAEAAGRRPPVVLHGLTERDQQP